MLEPGPPDLHAPPPETAVFACGFGDGGSISITQAGKRFTYSFGRKGRPEMQLRNGPGTALIFKHEGTAPRAGWTQLRFVNGTTSYVVFHYFHLGNFVRNYSGATEQSGLFVYERRRRVAKRLCKTGAGFDPGADLSGLPEDAEIDIVDNF